MGFIFNIPTKVVVGRIGELGSEVDMLGGKNVMVITDKLIPEDIIRKVSESLGKRLKFIFREVEPDTGCDIVNSACEIARSEGIDILVSVGGGSSIDTAKGVQILMKLGGKIEDHSGVYLMGGPSIPHIACPTTHGTGSEVSHVAVVKDKLNKRKLLYVDRWIMPNTAILDAELTLTLPEGPSLWSGIDALTHAVEAIHSTENNPISDTFALGAIKLIVENLPRVLENPRDKKARENMLISAMMGGAAFTNAQVGVIHAIAHSLGALFGIPHGLANGIMLIAGMKFNLPECKRYSIIADVLPIQKSKSQEENSQKVIEFFEDFLKKLGIPKLSKFIKEDDFDKVAELAIQDGSIISNPRFAMDKEIIKEILKMAY